MSTVIALAGNPNCGKTTMFNDLTGSNQYVGNWPGVTVEKKDGKITGETDVLLQDLPGIYSLSPYSPEEVVARGYLVNDRPDAIINIVDSTNLERNLYLTTQLRELKIPMVIALNMMDIARKSGLIIDTKKLGAMLGCEIVETSALNGEGSLEAVQKAKAIVGTRKEVRSVFSEPVQSAIRHIKSLLPVGINSSWYAIKLFERDGKVAEELKLPPDIMAKVESAISRAEAAIGDDSESIITGERYSYIDTVVSRCVMKRRKNTEPSASDKVDRVMTNKYLALPIFALIMFMVYYISVTTVGAIFTDFMNDTLIAGWIQAPLVNWLTRIGTAEWLVGLIGDGIIGGVGAVIGFVPQMLVLFLMLSILEDVGYMSRVAFIMDRIFSKFGLSGKSFIPLLVSSGCGVPGIMASRTIENERDRRMTIMTTTFVPCGAKMPIVALIAGALFGNAGWVAFTAYIIGVSAVIVSGIMLKKTRPFMSEPTPFVMELPAYHVPSAKNVFRATWERGWSFIKRAGTVIVLSSIIIWFMSGYGWVEVDNRTTFTAVENMDQSVLGHAGSVIAPVFSLVGFGDWKPTVATAMGLMAKEEVVNVLAILYGDTSIAAGFDEVSGGHAKLAAFCFLIFNLLCAPCFAAMSAIRKEMNSPKWTAFAIAYQCFFAYAVALIVYQLGLFLSGCGFTVLTAVALAILTAISYMLLSKSNPEHIN